MQAMHQRRLQHLHNKLVSAATMFYKAFKSHLVYYLSSHLYRVMDAAHIALGGGEGEVNIDGKPKMFGLAFDPQALLHEDVLGYFGFQKTSALGYKFGDTGLAPADVCPDLKKHRAREALFDAFATYADKATTLYDQIALAMLDVTALLVGECPDFTYEAAAAVVNSNVSGLFEDSAALNKYERLQSLLPDAMRQLIFCKGEQYVKHAFNVLTATDDDTSPVLETHAVVEDARAVIKAYASMLEVGEADSDYKAVSFVDLMLDTFNDAYRFLHLRGNTGDPTHWPGTMVPRLRVLRNR